MIASVIMRLSISNRLLFIGARTVRRNLLELIHSRGILVMDVKQRTIIRVQGLDVFTRFWYVVTDSNDI